MASNNKSPRRERLVPGHRLPPQLDQESLALAFDGQRLLVHWHGDGASLPRLDELQDLVRQSRFAVGPVQYLGSLEGRHCVAQALEAPAAQGQLEAPSGMALCGLRQLFGRLDEELFWLAGRAVQVVAWERDHRYCGRCGQPTEPHGEERAKRCPVCRLSFFPRLSPAVIVVVERGDELLLARSPHFPPGMFSALAGFVEPGESLEATLRREVREEVGIEVGELRYFGSQPWPFPNSLMVGFHGTYRSGELRPDPTEIEDAAWFPIDRLPKIPPRLSIARALIEDCRRRHLA